MAQDLIEGQGKRPMDRLKTEARGLVGALGDRALSSVRDRVEDTAGRLTDYVADGGGPGLMAAVTGAKDLAEGKGPVRSLLGAGLKGAREKAGGMFGKGGNGGGKGKNLKVTNIVESIDVGVPIRLAYNQWTRFTDFPGFMKKVENVEQAEEQTLNWKAQVLWSHRTWEATIRQQVPDEKIVWRSKGEKGHVDGAVTFHALTPDLTRILVVLEYHPQGLFEHTGNIWRAQGRRVRLELKHFRRHVMSEVLLHPDEIEGWRGVIEDGEVVQDHEAALAEEERFGDAGDGDQESDLADKEYPEDEYGEDEDEPVEEDEEDGERGARREPARERPARAAESGRASGRGSRRPAARPQRSGRTGRAEERPQRPVRRSGAGRGESR